MESDKRYIYSLNRGRKRHFTLLTVVWHQILPTNAFHLERQIF
jgi:hypothetical protein